MPAARARHDENTSHVVVVVGCGVVPHKVDVVCLHLVDDKHELAHVLHILFVVQKPPCVVVVDGASDGGAGQIDLGHFPIWRQRGCWCWVGAGLVGRVVDHWQWRSTWALEHVGPEPRGNVREIEAIVQCLTPIAVFTLPTVSPRQKSLRRWVAVVCVSTAIEAGLGVVCKCLGDVLGHQGEVVVVPVPFGVTNAPITINTGNIQPTQQRQLMQQILSADVRVVLSVQMIARHPIGVPCPMRVANLPVDLEQPSKLIIGHAGPAVDPVLFENVAKIQLLESVPCLHELAPLTSNHNVTIRVIFAFQRRVVFARVHDVYEKPVFTCWRRHAWQGPRPPNSVAKVRVPRRRRDRNEQRQVHFFSRKALIQSGAIRKALVIQTPGFAGLDPLKLRPLLSKTATKSYSRQD